MTTTTTRPRPIASGVIVASRAPSRRQRARDRSTAGWRREIAALVDPVVATGRIMPAGPGVDRVVSRVPGRQGGAGDRIDGIGCHEVARPSGSGTTIGPAVVPSSRLRHAVPGRPLARRSGSARPRCDPRRRRKPARVAGVGRDRGRRARHRRPSSTSPSSATSAAIRGSRSRSSPGAATRSASTTTWSSSGHARVTEGGAAEILAELARTYLGPDVVFPPMPNPPPGFVVRITVDRVSGIGPGSPSR